MPGTKRPCSRRGGGNPFTDLLSAIAGSVIGSSGGKLTSGLNSSVSNAISPNLTNFINNRAYSSSRPKAYLNWILLDEQLNYVQAGSNATQIPTVSGGAAKQAIVPSLQTMPKSGYLYIYVSNESIQDVYFDDITVQHYTGPLVSEESYYAFGGSMAALKSSAALKTQNCYKFNAGIELNESFDMDYYETAFRNYDAEIGRFTGVDAMAEETMHLTPYQFGGNDPVAYNDPTGLLQYNPEQLRESNEAMAGGNWNWMHMLDDDGGNGSYYQSHIAEMHSHDWDGVTVLSIQGSGVGGSFTREDILGGFVLAGGHLTEDIVRKFYEATWGNDVKNGVGVLSTIQNEVAGFILSFNPTNNNANNQSYNMFVANNQVMKGVKFLSHLGGFGDGGWKSYIPVFGSSREAYHDFENGNWGWGIFHTALTISDIFLIKSAVTAVGKGISKGIIGKCI